MGGERILGCNDFVESVLAKVNEEYEKQTIASAKGFSLEKALFSAKKYAKTLKYLLQRIQ